MQQCLRGRAELAVVPAATVDDLRQCLLGEKYDLIHFSGHGCVDGPLAAMVKAALIAQMGLPAVPLQRCLPPAVAALRQWLRTEAVAGETPTAVLLQPGETPSARIESASAASGVGSSEGGVSTNSSEGGVSNTDPSYEPTRLRLTPSDFRTHRVGALAFEGATGALEPPPPEGLARLLVSGLAPGGAIFLNACDTLLQARWLLHHGASRVIYVAGRISDGAAAEFSRGFYEAFACGRGVGAAYETGQLAVELIYETEKHGCPALMERKPTASAPAAATAGPAAQSAAVPPLPPPPSGVPRRQRPSQQETPSVEAVDSPGLATASADAASKVASAAAAASDAAAADASYASGEGAALVVAAAPLAIAAASPLAAAAAPPFVSAPAASSPASGHPSGRVVEGLRTELADGPWKPAAVLELPEDFQEASVVGGGAPLLELVPMHSSKHAVPQLAVCETTPRMVRDALGRLHALGTFKIIVPRLEAALPVDKLPRPPPDAATFRRTHRLLGRAHELRVGVLNRLRTG